MIPRHGCNEISSPTQPVGCPSFTLFHHFASVYAPNDLQSEAGLPCPIQSLSLVFYAEVLHLRPRSHREENQTLNICLNPEAKTKYCVTFLVVTYFEQQSSYLHNTRKPLEWATCFAILSVGYCGATTDLIWIPLSFCLNMKSDQDNKEAKIT